MLLVCLSWQSCSWAFSNIHSTWERQLTTPPTRTAVPEPQPRGRGGRAWWHPSRRVRRRSCGVRCWMRPWPPATRACWTPSTPAWWTRGESGRASRACLMGCMLGLKGASKVGLGGQVGSCDRKSWPPQPELPLGGNVAAMMRLVRIANGMHCIVAHASVSERQWPDLTALHIHKTQTQGCRGADRRRRAGAGDAPHPRWRPGGRRPRLPDPGPGAGAGRARGGTGALLHRAQGVRQGRPSLRGAGRRASDWPTPGADAGAEGRVPGPRHPPGARLGVSVAEVGGGGE